MALSLKEFAAGMYVLGETYGREVTPKLLEVYHRALGSRFDPGSWAEAVDWVIANERFWPTPAVFLQRQKAESSVNAETEANLAFEQVNRCYIHNVHSGPVYSESAILERHGALALEAFRAAGGALAFRSSDEKQLAFVRKAFVEHYEGRRKAESLPRCLPEHGLAELPALRKPAVFRLSPAPKGD